MANIQTYNFENVIKNDTFNGFNVTITVNGSPLDLTNYDIKMYLRYNNKKGYISKQFGLGSGLSITDAVNGKLSLAAFIADIEEGTHYYDLQFTEGSVVKTYLEGVFKVVQDVTYD